MVRPMVKKEAGWRTRHNGQSTGEKRGRVESTTPKPLCDTLSHPGDIPEVEEVVDLGWRGQELVHNNIVHVYCGLSQHVRDGLHVLVKLHQLLVNHAAKDPLDLGLLQTKCVNKRKKKSSSKLHLNPKLSGNKSLCISYMTVYLMCRQWRQKFA